MLKKTENTKMEITLYLEIWGITLFEGKEYKAPSEMLRDAV